MNIATAVTDQVFKVLLVEDNPGDAHLVRELLRDMLPDSFEVTWVERLSEAMARLADEAFDIILLDLSLPDTSGLETLIRMNNAARDLPIIVLTGHGDETLGVQALGKGAQDYLLKQNLDSFLLKRMLHYAIERKRAEESLRESESRSHRVLDHLLEGAEIIGFDWHYLYVNDAAAAHGRQLKDVLLRSTVLELYPGIENTDMFAVFRTCMEARTAQHFETEFVFPDGTKTWFDLRVQPIPEGIFILSLDITERKRGEQALRQSEQRLRDVLETLPIAVWLYDANGQITYGNPAGHQVWAGAKYVGPEQFGLYQGWWVETGKPLAAQDWAAARVFTRGETSLNEEIEIECFDGTHKFILNAALPLRNHAGAITGAVSLNQDITERKHAEEALRQSERRYRSLFENMLNGFAYCKMEFEHGRPHDFLYLEVNTAFETLTGLKHVVGKKVSEVIPGIQASNPELFASYGRVALTGQPEMIEIHLASLSMWLSIAIYSPQKEYFVTIFEVITERKRAENALRQYNRRLGVLHEIDRGILTAQPPQKVAERVAQSLAELIPCGAVRIIALDSNGKTLPYLAAYPPASQTAQDLLGQAIENYGLPESFRRGEALLIDDTQIHERLWVGFEEILTAQGARSWIIAPLIAAEQLVGILAVGSLQPLAFTSEHVEVVHEVADQLAIALHKNHLDEQIQEHARRLEARVSERTKELHSAKERIETILMSVSDAIIVANLDGSIQQVNTAFTVLFGYTLEQTRTMSLYSLLDSTSGATVHRIGAELAEGGKTQHVELVGLRQDGTPFDADAAFAPVVDGLPTILICSIHDITERKAQERQLRYHASLQENVTDAVIATDLGFCIQSWNPAAERIYGWRAEEVLGRLVGEILSTEFASEASGERVQQEFLEKGFWTDEVIQHHKDGHALHIMSSTVLFKDENGQPFGLVAVNHDITVRIKAENELRQALAKEKDLNELKTRFVSMVSHDFRSPLASIQSSSDLLRNYSERMTDEKKQKHFATISGQIKHLTGLLEDMLTVTKADSIGLPYHPVLTDLGVFCQTIADEMQALAGTHQIRFSINRPGELIGIDPELLRRAIVNLLSNAVKYSLEGSVAEFSVSIGDEQVEIRVKDQGIGIPEDDQAHLFEVFHRARNVGSIPGTGLGLAIVKRAVDAHGGTISVQSKVGVGTTFTVQLPIVPDTSTA